MAYKAYVTPLMKDEERALRSEIAISAHPIHVISPREGPEVQHLRLLSKKTVVLKPVVKNRVAANRGQSERGGLHSGNVGSKWGRLPVR